jgi:hypothetical protein
MNKSFVPTTKTVATTRRWTHKAKLQHSFTPEVSSPTSKRRYNTKRSSRKTRKERSCKNTTLLTSLQHGAQIRRILKRRETLIPSVVCPDQAYEENDDFSVISALSLYSELDGAENYSDNLPSFPPNHCFHEEKRRPLICSIRVLDAHQVLDDSPCWFRVYFDGSGDFVELEGEEVLDFCSVLIEYDQSWIFDVTPLSCGVLTRVHGRHIVDTLHVFLSLTTLPEVETCVKPRMPWQTEWVFF